MNIMASEQASSTINPSPSPIKFCLSHRISLDEYFSESRMYQEKEKTQNKTEL